MLMMTFSPMSIRPSIVPEPMCGSSTTLVSFFPTMGLGGTGHNRAPDRLTYAEGRITRWFTTVTSFGAPQDALAEEIARIPSVAAHQDRFAPAAVRPLPEQTRVA